MSVQLKLRIDLEVVKDIFTLINEFKETAWGMPDEAFRFEAVRVLKDVKEILTHAVNINKKENHE